MADLQGFDANNVEPAEDFDPLPAGKYVAVIIESEYKPTKNNSGIYLQLTFEVIEGDHKGLRVWARLNLENANATAVKIARQELSAICRAVGVMTPKDSSELHDRPLVIGVKCKKRKDSEDLANEIKGYTRHEPVASKPTQAANPTPPWRR
jgi:hypothetical protein